MINFIIISRNLSLSDPTLKNKTVNYQQTGTQSIKLERPVTNELTFY